MSNKLTELQDTVGDLDHNKMTPHDIQPNKSELQEDLSAKEGFHD